MTSILASEEPAFDCTFQIENRNFNLTNLGREISIERTRETPPSRMVDTVLFNLCDDLKPKAIAKEDQVCAILSVSNIIMIEALKCSVLLVLAAA